MEFRWGKAEQEYFQELKQALTAASVLRYPDFLVPLRYIGCGYNFTQHHDGNERAIFYGGRDFTNTEMNYSTTEKETLAIV